MATLKRFVALLLLGVLLGGGLTYGLRRYVRYLVRLDNHTTLQVVVHKPRIALDMWKRKFLPKPLQIVVTPKTDQARRNTIDSLVDYTFYEKDELFEYTVKINEAALRQYDPATQRAVKDTIAHNVTTMLFPASDHTYLEIDP